jgi:hypothetical protein
MDELVKKLGYMDYRDALACNKYILEAKRSQDYGQQARGRVLQAALMRYSDLQRKEIDQEARTKVRDSQSGGDHDKVQQAKLELLMQRDPTVASIY